MERNGIVGNQTETRHVRAREFSRGKKKKRKKRKEKKRRKEKWSVLFRNEPANGTVRVIKLLWHVSGANCYACSRKFLNSKEQERETATRRERRASKGEAKRKEREERERERERETKRKGQVASIWRPEFPGEKGNQKSKESLQIRGPECSAVAATWTRRTALLFTPEQCCLCRDVIKLWINFLLRWFYTGLSSIFEYSFSFLVTGPCFRFLSRWNAGRANNPTQPNVRSENVPRINRRFFFFPSPSISRFVLLDSISSPGGVHYVKVTRSFEPDGIGRTVHYLGTIQLFLFRKSVLDEKKKKEKKNFVGKEIKWSIRGLR